MLWDHIIANQAQRTLLAQMQVGQGQGQSQRNAEHRINWPNFLISLLESLL